VSHLAADTPHPASARMAGVVASRWRLAVLPAVLLATVAACGTAPTGQQSWDGDAGPTAGRPAVPPATPSRNPTGPAAPPSPTSPPRTSPASAGPGWRYVFPVAASPVSYRATHSGYPATDIFAACGAPVRAVADGLVLEVSRVDRFDPGEPDGALKGGLFVSMRGDDGVRYYGSHLSSVAAGVDRGLRVRAGQRLGAVGRTGDASNVCHLHFGISPPCRGVGDWWIRRGVVWPASFLDAWRTGTPRSPAATVTAWRATHGCPAAPPG
jgi:murein DD-endopeptidase MepM/ murein hydrolase activator NlpD